MKRILFTGARDWADSAVIRLGILRATLEPASRLDPGARYGELRIGVATLIHGDAPGADQLADEAGQELKLEIERYPARDFASPRARNQHMVNLGADICIACALTWASGTGMCARMARKAGIQVVDYGVDTRLEARP
ncbi:MAG TPA: hypothetical protein VFX53_05065 [Pedococcus sp.]|nr:hypothetical protein [Pedococcus sp.]